MAIITFYDFSDLNYAGLFLQGFLDLHEKAELSFKVSNKIPEELKGLELPTWITYRKPPSTSVFRYEDNNEDFLFCIDANDHNGLEPGLPDIFPGYHLPLIEKVKHYFKVNYFAEVVETNPAVSQFKEKIFPLPLVYPLNLSKKRPFIPNLVPLYGRGWPMGVVRRRINKLRNYLSLDWYRQIRQQPKDLDLFFMTTIYTGKNHEEKNAWRLELLRAISAHKQLNTVIGFVSNSNLSGEFAHFQQPPVPFDTYIQQLARSKIGLYTRGTFDCISFKFGQYFALGKAIVGKNIRNNRENMYAYDNFSEQFTYEEPQEIADRIAELIADPAKLNDLSQKNTATFEKCFIPEAVVRQILDRIMPE